MHLPETGRTRSLKNSEMERLACTPGPMGLTSIRRDDPAAVIHALVRLAGYGSDFLQSSAACRKRFVTSGFSVARFFDSLGSATMS